VLTPVTAAQQQCPIFVPIRPGTNIAYLGGLINYILENEKYHKEYVDNYTNASYLINENFSFDEVNGLFTGAEPDSVRSATKYNMADWQYQADADGNILKDPTLERSNCSFQLLKKHYSKYTISNISKITGTPEDTLKASYELFSSTGQAGKAGNILYAMGITQFTHGAQNTRAIAVVQFCLATWVSVAVALTPSAASRTCRGPLIWLSFTISSPAITRRHSRLKLLLKNI
jgi:formate dehydrogenase major subunit